MAGKKNQGNSHYFIYNMNITSYLIEAYYGFNTMSKVPYIPIDTYTQEGTLEI